MTDPVSVPPSLPAPRFAADTAGRRGALSSRSSPYLKPLEGDFQPEPSRHYRGILLDMDLSRPEFCFFSRGQPEPVLLFSGFFQRSDGILFLFFFLSGPVRVTRFFLDSLPVLLFFSPRGCFCPVFVRFF